MHAGLREETKAEGLKLRLFRDTEEKYRERLGPVEGYTLCKGHTHEMHCRPLGPVHLAGQADKRDLPADITSLHCLDCFRQKLNTFLFRQAYGPSAI